MRFKYTGDRLKQMQKEDLPKIREDLVKQIERDTGQKITPERYKLCDETAREIANMPKYGG